MFPVVCAVIEVVFDTVLSSFSFLEILIDIGLLSFVPIWLLKTCLLVYLKCTFSGDIYLVRPCGIIMWV